MNIKESVEQLESLIEAWELNEADLNQTDIDALMMILKENQELKKQLKNIKQELTDERDENYKLSELWCDGRGKVRDLETQQKEFIKYLENESKEVYRDGGLRQNIFRQILQKYKEITGDDK